MALAAAVHAATELVQVKSNSMGGFASVLVSNKVRVLRTVTGRKLLLTIINDDDDGDGDDDDDVDDDDDGWYESAVTGLAEGIWIRKHTCMYICMHKDNAKNSIRSHITKKQLHMHGCCACVAQMSFWKSVA